MRLPITAFIMLVIAVVSLAGFRGDKSRKPPMEIFPDMDRQMKLRPQEPNSFFANGRSSQPYVEGVVPRSEPLDVNGVKVYPFEEHPLNTGFQVGTTNWVTFNQLPVTAERLKRGQERFAISCSPCHGKIGDGQGIVSQYGWATIANLHDARIVSQPDGEIFGTISNGRNTMSGYANKISIEDRWAIVAYVRALQLSQLGRAGDVPTEEKASLNL